MARYLQDRKNSPVDEFPLLCCLSAGTISNSDAVTPSLSDRPRDSEPEGHRSLEVYDQLDFRRLHDRQVGRLLAFENPTRVDAGLAIRIGNTASVTHQAAAGGKLAELVDCGHRIAER